MNKPLNVRRVIADAPREYPNSESLQDHKGVRLGLDEAITFLSSSLISEVMVHAPYVGLISVDKKQILRRLEGIKRAWETHGEPGDVDKVEAKFSVSPRRVFSRRAGDTVDRGFRVSLSHTGIWNGDRCQTRGY